jgi:DNA-binding response OmpR family regulator
MLRRAAGDLPEIYRFGDAEVDFGRRELRLAGRPVETTPLEFRLLEAFVHRHGRVLSRQQLLDAAWGREVNVTDRVVDNQINHLRRKIAPALPDQPPRHRVSFRWVTQSRKARNDAKEFASWFSCAKVTEP